MRSPPFFSTQHQITTKHAKMARWSTILLIVSSCIVCLLSQQQVAAATAQQQIISHHMPLFAWSSAGGAAADTKHIQSLQVHPSLHDTFEQLLTGVHRGAESPVKQWVDSHALAEHRPDIMLAVLGSQLKSSDMKARAMQATLQPLRAMLNQAASSLAAPYVLHQAATRTEHVSSLQWLASDMQVPTTVVGCSAGSASSLKEALKDKQEQGPHLVVLCTEPPALGLQGSAEAVAGELRQVQQAHDEVAQLGAKRQLTIYAAIPDEALPAQRQLLGVQADVGSCGQLCQTQVKWLEGILATLILAIAAFSGMCCLSMLDTPTRFEKAKEGMRNE